MARIANAEKAIESVEEINPDYIKFICNQFIDETFKKDIIELLAFVGREGSLNETEIIKNSASYSDVELAQIVWNTFGNEFDCRPSFNGDPVSYAIARSRFIDNGSGNLVSATICSDEYNFIVHPSTFKWIEKVKPIDPSLQEIEDFIRKNCTCAEWAALV